MSNRLASYVVAGMLVAPAIASAASISGQPTTQPSIPANLSEVGTLDWAYWHVNTTNFLPERAPTNSKAGSTAIGDALPYNDTGLRGSTSATTGISFRFDDGANPTTDGGVPVVMRGVFATPGRTGLRGVQVSVTLPDADTLYNVLVWVSGYRATGEFIASLDGATSYIDSSFAAYQDQKAARLYELNVVADSPNDVLNLTYYQKSGGDDNSHVLLGGIAISAVPEPAAMGLLAPVAVLALRRRKHA